MYAYLFIYRRDEKERRQKQRRAHQHPHPHPLQRRQQQQQQPNYRPIRQQSPDWFAEANQNYGHGQNHHRQADGWTPGFDAATTAQTNFGETPQTTHQTFDDAHAQTAAQSRPQLNFMNPF